ncbi:PqqD family protein [Candidatus Dependentiae bacterium]|nr:PqqD family protein [Candidatus Dependentiae bacterium]
MNLKIIPCRNKAILFRREKDKTVLLDELSGSPYYLESTGSYIWNIIDGKKNLKDILNELIEKFDSDKKVIKTDLIEFITELLENQIITVKKK